MSPQRCQYSSWEGEQPERRAAWGALKPIRSLRRSGGIVVAVPALAPPAAGIAEGTLEGAAAKRSGQALEARPSHLADVAFDDEQAEQHDQKADDAEREDAGERRDQEDEADDEPGDSPFDHPGRVPVEGGVGNLLHQL